MASAASWDINNFSSEGAIVKSVSGSGHRHPGFHCYERDKVKDVNNRRVIITIVADEIRA